MRHKYVVITPVRDEEEHLRSTIGSMANQTVRPAEWVIVDDGSGDGTARIVDESAEHYPWINAVHRKNRGFRYSGGGVVEAFNDGYRALRCRDWDFIVKLDGDLSFPPRYFEQCFEEFAREPKLGVAGGSIYNMERGRLRLEDAPSFHVRGATKIYRRECWHGIGGLWPAPGWDTIDEVKAQMLGWGTRTFAGVHLIHHRPTGATEGNWGASVKYGLANYICGYHPLFMLCKCLLRLPRRPYVIGSLALLYGFLSGYVKQISRVSDPAAIGYLRQQQVARLTGRATIWK
jgi:glycosyltransferase involved in cell wall biosynthesis